MVRRINQWWGTSQWLNEGTKRKTFVLPALIIVLGLIGTVVLGVRQANDRSNVALFRADVNTYITSYSTYSGCVNRSQSRDDLSEALNGLYDFLQALAVRLGADDIATEVKAIQDTFNASFELVPIEECGLPPIPPEGVTPALATTSTLPG